MKLSISVMSHPKRAEKIGPLRAAVPGLTVITDPEPDTRTNWTCARVAWLSYDHEATHHLVLEDDAVPCSNFRPAVERLIANRPDNVISLWANSVKIEEALRKGETLIYAPWKWLGAVAVLMPVSWCAPMVQYGDMLDYNKAQDVPLRDFFKVMDERVLWTAPSLVEHGEPEESVLWGVKKMPVRRVARAFIEDTDYDPMTISWHGAGRVVQSGI